MQKILKVSIWSNRVLVIGNVAKGSEVARQAWKTAQGETPESQRERLAHAGQVCRKVLFDIPVCVLCRESDKQHRYQWR